MIFNDHSKLEGAHALLSPSGYHWINYADDNNDPIFQKIKSQYSTVLGTLVHEYAEKRIKFNMKLTKHDKNDVLFYLLCGGIPEVVIDIDYIFENLFHYVNDAIGFKMQPEVILYYSDNCFGTADAIRYDERNHFLRIHDLKTGKVPAHIEQLEIYAALFFLEYGVKPKDTDVELRIYQEGNLIVMNPALDDIVPIMDKIITLDSKINKIKQGVM